jgi:hypothetical protein
MGELLQAFLAYTSSGGFLTIVKMPGLYMINPEIVFSSVTKKEDERGG